MRISGMLLFILSWCADGHSAERNLTANNKWVSFGGSYPGMQAGWLRLKYPNLIHAAVASSAPGRPTCLH
jgi:hypothetical protein